MKLNILIVDDDKKILSVLQSLLMEEKHEVVTCNDGLEAIERFQDQKFDLVITDLQMPGATGIEVLKETRRIHPDTLVILITGFASLETARQAIREGAYDYITKPFKLEEIKIVVNNAGEKINLIRENQRLFQELQDAYKELHMLKRIMGAREEDNTEEKTGSPESIKDGPLIAGSMLPYYYQKENPDNKTLFFSDLERISTLKERGFLSEEEFNLCKSKLLQNLNH